MLNSFQGFLNNPLTGMLVLVVAAGFLALVATAVLRIFIGLRGSGTDKMQAVALLVRKGTMKYLWKKYQVAVLFIFVIGTLIYVFIDTGWESAQLERWALPYTAVSFVVGAFMVALSGFIGIRTAIAAHVRVTHAARTSLSHALRVAFVSGTTASLVALGLGVIVLAAGVYTLSEIWVVGLPQVLQSLIGLLLGASSMSFFSTIGGGMFGAASALGVEILNETESRLPEEDVFNPAVIVRIVGESASGVLGSGADLLGSFVSAILAAMIIGLTVSEDAMVFPLLFSAAGVVITIISCLCVRIGKGEKNVFGAFKKGVYVHAILSLFAAYLLAQWFFPADSVLSIFLAITSGIVLGLCVHFFVEHKTELHSKAVRMVAGDTRGGVAPTFLGGLSAGYVSTFFPVVLIAVAVIVAYEAADLYGIALAALGALSMFGITLAIDAYAPVASTAGRFAQMAHLPKQVNVRTESLFVAADRLSSAQSALSLIAASLTTISLLVVFTDSAGLRSVDLINPVTLIGLLMGASLPYLFSSFMLIATQRAAGVLAEEVRRQFKEVKGIMDGTAEGDSTKAVRLTASAVFRDLCLPIFLALALPLGIGVVLGTEALAAVLAGALVSAFFIALTLTVSTGAWTQAKSFIEAGNLGGKESDMHTASATCDIAGYSLKKGVVPGMNVLLKILTIVSLVTVGFFSASGLIG